MFFIRGYCLLYVDWAKYALSYSYISSKNYYWNPIVVLYGNCRIWYRNKLP